MSKVRVLVGTRKGAFILTSDGKREKWDVSGPHFAGWELFHLKGSPADPNRIYASQTSGWFGQVIQRSDDGGKTWHQPGTPPGETTTPEGMPKGESNKFAYDTSAETGKPLTTQPVLRRQSASWEFQARVASGTVADRSGYGVRRGGRRRHFPLPPTVEKTGMNFPACAATAPVRMAAGRGRHVSAHDHSGSEQLGPDLYRHFRPPGAFRTDDGGKTWKPINRGRKSQYIPDPDAEVGHCVHHSP